MGCFRQSRPKALANSLGQYRHYHWYYVKSVLLSFRYLSADVGPGVINAVIAALADNTRVEALYIQNFERVRGPSAGQKVANIRVVNDALHLELGCSTAPLPASGL